MTKRFGFTLAEVLITLGIIGVVAAMTMPTLINQTNGAQFRAGFKKELSVLAQAAALNKALDDWDFSGVGKAKGEDGSAAGESLTTLLKDRINTVGGDDLSKLTENDYATTAGKFSVTDTVKPDGTKAIEFKNPSTPQYVRFNDSAIFIYDEYTSDGKGCVSDSPCFGYIDVNGTKGPNKVTTCDDSSKGDDCYVKANIGDVFPVYFYDQTILPATYAGNAVLSDKTKANSTAEEGPEDGNE